MNACTKEILVITFIIFIVNLVFRLITQTEAGIWYDEAFSIFHSQKELFLIKNVSTWDIAPPFYYYVLHYWMLVFGIGEHEVRMLGIMCICLSVSILFLFSYRFFNLEIALFTTILFSTSNEIFYFSQEARAYSLLVLLSVVSSFLFFQLLIKPKWFLLIALGVINWAGIYTHYFFLFVPAIQCSVALVCFNKRVISFMFLSVILTIAIFGKWLHRIYEVFTQGNTSQSNPILKSYDFLILIKSLAGESVMFYILVPLSVVGLLFLIKTGFKNFKSEKLIQVLYVLLIAFFPITALYFFSHGMGGVFTPRYILFSLPSIVLFISYLLSKINWGTKLKPTLMILLLVVGVYTINYRFEKFTDYKKAIPVVVKNKTENTLVIVQSSVMYQLFSYYFDKNIFKDYKNTELLLKEKNIIFKEDSSSINPQTSLGFNKVILLQSFENGCAPQASIKKYLELRFKNTEVFNNFLQAKLTIYTNPYNDPVIGFKNRIENL